MIINLLTYCRITNKMDTIFVSVASYRDDECPATLEYLFGKADNPHNVYIGICQQNDSDNGDIDCVFENAKYDIFKNPTTTTRAPIVWVLPPTSPTSATITKTTTTTTTTPEPIISDPTISEQMLVDVSNNNTSTI